MPARILTLMDWREEGLLLAARPHGETSAILEVFTAGQGRHAGVLRGGASRKMAAMIQPGTQVDAAWRARLSDHLGTFTVETVRGRAAQHMSDPTALAGLASVCAILAFTLPERQAKPRLYAHSVALLDGLGAADWASAYLRWELALLDDLGFGLDLGACALTGATEALAFVSPRTGRAVTAAAARPYADRLLPLPPGLTGRDALSPGALAQGLALTGHFLDCHVAPALGDRPLPRARGRLVDRLTRAS